MELALARLEALVDAETFDRQPAVVVAVLFVELEEGAQPGAQPSRGIRLVPCGPVDAASEQGRHLLMEGAEDRLLVAEIKIEGSLGEAGQSDDGAHRGPVIAVALEDPTAGVEQLAAAHQLAGGRRERGFCPRGD